LEKAIKEDVSLSIQPIIRSLDTLINVHKELIYLSQEKTEVLKKGSAEELQKVLIQEQKFIHKLDQAESKREKAVKTWFTQKQLNGEEETITHMLSLLTNDQEKHQLETSAIALTKSMTQLKENEQLNEALVQQSMQFIQMSLNVLQPSMQNMNYERPQQTRTSQVIEQSVFDSKA